MPRWAWIGLLGLALPALAQDLQLARSLLCRDVVQREPAGIIEAEQLPAGVDKLVLFTEIKDGSGQKVHHRWYHNGELQADVALRIGADRWRTWSEKKVSPGQWRLEVLTDGGDLLYQRTLTLGPVESPSP